MILALISINTDLGSSIALRYAYELSNKIDMRLYDIHVVDAKQSGSSPGFGWVQKTWENALIESKSEEIRQFLDMEKVELPFLKTPKILIGDRTEKLLDELQTGQYAFFLEGALPSFNPNDFYRLVHSRLYRLMPCPVMIVKNLVSELFGRSAERLPLTVRKGVAQHFPCTFLLLTIRKYRSAFEIYTQKPYFFFPRFFKPIFFLTGANHVDYNHFKRIIQLWKRDGGKTGGKTGI